MKKASLFILIVLCLFAAAVPAGASTVTVGMSQEPVSLDPAAGLFIPEHIPTVGAEELRALCAMDYRGRAIDIMGRFLPEFSAKASVAPSRNLWYVGRFP